MPSFPTASSSCHGCGLCSICLSVCQEAGSSVSFVLVFLFFALGWFDFIFVTACQSQRTSTRSQRPMWSMFPSFCQSCGNESLVLAERLITCRVCVMAHSFAFPSLMSISFSTVLIYFPLFGWGLQSRTCSETQDSAPAFQRG